MRRLQANKEKRTCSSNQISGKQQWDEQFAFGVEVIQMNEENASERETVASKEDFSCSPNGSRVEMEKACCEEQPMLTNTPSEVSAKSCRSKRKSSTIKPCSVLLKNIDCEFTKGHEYCLIPPNTKKLPQKRRNARKIGIFKALQAGLNDLLDRHCLKRQGGTQNPATLPGNRKENQVESGLEVSSSAKVLSKETNTGSDVKNAERKANFPDSSPACDNIFETSSFIKSNLDISVAGLCHAQENEEVAISLQADSVVIPETQHIVSFEPTEKWEGWKNMANGKTSIEQTERKESSHGTYMLVSECSGEASTGNTGQPSRIDMGPVIPGETLQASRTYSSVILCSETKFSGACHRNMGASVLCEFEPYLVSSLPGEALKLDLKDEFPTKNKIKTPVERRMNQCSIQSSTEVVIQERVTVEEQDALHQTNSIPRKENNNSCWINLEKDEVLYFGGPAYEENMPQRMQNGDHSSDVPPSGCPSFQDYITNIKHGVIQKETELNGRKISSAEECGNSQPAKENRLVGELSRSTVKLLGTPRNKSKMLSLNRIIELEDSSDSEVQSSSHLAEYQESQGYSPSLNKETEGSLYSTEVTWHKPLYSDDSRAVDRRTCRPNKRRALIHPSKLSQEESRIKVVDALKEVLQKRLDDSPDLSVQEGTVLRLAKKVEKALFSLSCRVNQHYKNKYRSLLFNLKSPKNQCLFNKVILGVISPERLVQMNALELAPEELSEWRARKHKYALEAIEKEEREVPRCCLTKFTHKGIIEIHRETDEDLTFQDRFASQLLEDENSLLEAPSASMTYSGENKSHVWDSDCFSDAVQMAADHDGRFKPPTRKGILKQEVNASRYLASSAVYSDRGERRLKEASPISGSIPKKHLQVRNQSRTSVIWRGVIQMFSLKPFAAKAYLVSGSRYPLFQDIPDLLQSRGCILPEDVWEYLDSIWPANAKEMALIRFHPSLRKGCNPYNRLYSYLNNKQRYGIVDSNQMEMFMVSLAAYQPVSSKLHPLSDPGLDPRHPSLLLGLILPKKLPSRPQPSPKAKRKHVTFKDNVETCFFLPPSQVDTCWMEPPPHLSLSEPLWGHDCPAAVLPMPDPLTSEELGSEMFLGDLSSSQFVTAESETVQSLLDALLQSQCGSPSMGRQLGSLTLETSGAQSQEAGRQVQLCPSPGPLGLLLPPACPNQGVEEGVHRVNLSDASLLLIEPCLEPVSPAGVSQAALPPQIFSTTPLAGDTHMLVEEAFSLIQHMTQLPPHRTLNQPPEPPPVFGFPETPQETASALSPVAAGLGFPAVQQGEDLEAQLQLLLSTLGGPSQPPSTR